MFREIIVSFNNAGVSEDELSNKKIRDLSLATDYRKYNNLLMKNNCKEGVGWKI